ncbi:MAG TPA: hypothetical protein VJZ49_09480 [Syntrophales bacterium]|nr:hypothetical protein [Syntrophales bacterium]
MDIVVLINLILCALIVVFGVVGFKKSKDTLPLFIAISFGLFGIAHLLTLLELTEGITGLLIAIRTLAYLLVLYIVYRAAFRK